MKNQHKVVFKYFIIFFGIIITTIIVYNYFADNFFVFSKDFSQEHIDSKKYWPNERVIKTNYIIQSKAFDSFWFGSSESNYTSVSDLPNGKWYNSCAKVTSIYEMLYLLKIYKANGVNIKNVVFQLSDTSFSYPYSVHKGYTNEFAIDDWYPLSLEDKISFYAWYLIYPISLYQTPDIWRDECKNHFKVDGSCAYPPEKEKEMKFFDGYSNPIFPTYSEVWVKDMKDLIRFCKNNGIKTTVFIAPQSGKLSTKYNKYDYEKCRKELAKITPYYDFSGQNEITTNLNNFHDNIH